VREETLRRPETLNVDAGENGGIVVRGWNRDDVRLRVRITSYARTASEARDLASSVKLTTSEGRVRAEGPQNVRDASWSASFEVEAPRNSRLMLNAQNGGLSLADFSGTAELRTINGGVAVAEAGGDIRGRTQNGGISVQLSGGRWEGRGLDLETINGGVYLVVPSNYSAELEAVTVNGGIRIDFPVSGRRTRQIRSTLGSGGPPIRAVTTNGGVTIRRQ
jgi:DUF4097 and DUF4098 domain-containing protein YvlB